MRRLTYLLFVSLLFFSFFLRPALAQSTQIILESPESLTLEIPPALSYSLIDPMSAGTEVISSGEQVTLIGNAFRNQKSQPYITVMLVGEVPNASLSIEGVSVFPEGGDVSLETGQRARIPLENMAAAAYAMPDKSQDSTYGVITGTHNLAIRKNGPIPAGAYELTIIWSASDGGASGV